MLRSDSTTDCPSVLLTNDVMIKECDGMTNEKVFSMSFAKVYPMLLA